KLGAGGNVNEFRADAQQAAALHDSAGKNGANVELATYGLSVDGTPLVAEDGALGHHPEFWHRGQSIDQAGGDAVAEMLVLGVAAEVFERQDGERVWFFRDALWAGSGGCV